MVQFTLIVFLENTFDNEYLEILQLKIDANKYTSVLH